MLMSVDAIRLTYWLSISCYYWCIQNP